MSAKLLERTIGGLLLFVAAGMVVHTPLTLWLGLQFPAYELFIKSWKELLMGLALVLLIVVAVRRKLLDTFMADRVVQLSLVYAGIHFVLVGVFQDGLETAGAGLLIDLRYILYFVLVYLYIRLFPGWRRLFVTVMAAGAAIIIGFAALQALVLPKDILASIGYSKETISPYLTVDENPDYVRVNSTLRGPNPLGAYAVIVLGLLTAVVMRWRLQTRTWLLVAAAFATTLLALAVSHSRSSYIAAAAAVSIIVIVCITITMRKWLIAGLIVATLVAGSLVWVNRDSDFVANVILHNSPTTGAHIDSNSGHAESLEYGMDRMIHQPIGAGIGSTGSPSLLGDKPLIIENQYLYIAHEVGWIGLAVFVWLFVEILRRLWRRRQSALALGVFGSGIGLAIIGLLLPVWVDDTVSIVWWGLAGLAIAAPLAARPTSSKKPTKSARKKAKKS